ncbi:hypothetical protein L226DRAFT_24187 [Lentinus tigrinus ALCF2SS1-7]|uniref:uncharacterized protein n=1 Tax=Lentinus tigrinus ALCF2SS1-7 TaxID=1328758 RepID=UPI0011661E1F|nr:hypothetical protein L226DRAFT_24187 [Lentinus tigrinus ALCF2SS1-7]
MAGGLAAACMLRWCVAPDVTECTPKWRTRLSIGPPAQRCSSSRVRTKLESPYTTDRGRPRAGQGTPVPGSDVRPRVSWV